MPKAQEGRITRGRRHKKSPPSNERREAIPKTDLSINFKKPALVNHIQSNRLFLNT